MGPSATLVEIGFGTAELFRRMLDEFNLLVGVEISQEMVNCALHLHPELASPRVHLFTGNATELISILAGHFPSEHAYWGRGTLRIVCLVMNTFGILPEHIRGQCLTQMFLCAGPGGKVVLGCWHKQALRTGFLEFYSRNPKLCGHCSEEDFDFEKGDFRSSNDYTSHWWSQ
jgi:hypothetical protein